MNIIKNDRSKCVALSNVLETCPDYKCLKDPSRNINLENIYQMTLECFDNLKPHKINNQSGGSHIKYEPSGDLYDGTPFSNVKDLYVNVKKYMKLHNIVLLEEDQLIPYGIILKTLNLPDNPLVLSEIYPQFIEYIAKNNIEDLNFGTLIPIGFFMNEADINNINHLKI